MKASIRRKTFLGISLGTFAGLTSRLFGQQGAGDLERALHSEGLTQARANELLASSIPVGGIIPYVGTLDLPPNWQVCDGSDLKEEASGPLKARLGGKTPSMVGRVPRGVNRDDPVSVSVGSDRVEHSEWATVNAGGHRHGVEGHSHEVSSRTGLVASDAPSSTQPMALKSDERWVSNSHFSHVRDIRFGDMGQHRHDFVGRTSTESPYTTSEGQHSHQIPGIDHIPASLTVVYIIRVF